MVEHHQDGSYKARLVQVAHLTNFCLYRLNCLAYLKRTCRVFRCFLWNKWSKRILFFFVKWNFQWNQLSTGKITVKFFHLPCSSTASSLMLVISASWAITRASSACRSPKLIFFIIRKWFSIIVPYPHWIYVIEINQRYEQIVMSEIIELSFHFWDYSLYFTFCIVAPIFTIFGIQFVWIATQL